LAGKRYASPDVYERKLARVMERCALGWMVRHNARKPPMTGRPSQTTPTHTFCENVRSPAWEGCQVTWDDAAYIVEGRLIEYGNAMAEFPGPAVSSLGQALSDLQELGTTIRPPGHARSPENKWEQWAWKYRYALQDAPIIESVMKCLPEREREFVELRYWGPVKSTREFAKRKHVSQRTADYIRQRVITAFALAWGLWEKTG